MKTKNNLMCMSFHSSYSQKWKTVTGRQYSTNIRSVFNHCDVGLIGQQM